MDTMCGLDILGADPVYGPSMSSGTVYTDKATITAVQKALASRNYFHGVVDGVFGPVTEAAIFNFSGQHGPPDDALLAKLGLSKTKVVAPNKAPMVFEPDVITLKPSPLNASWWQQPAWAGGWERWKIALAAGGGGAGLVTILVALLSGGKVSPVRR